MMAPAVPPQHAKALLAHWQIPTGKGDDDCVITPQNNIDCNDLKNGNE